MLLLLTHTGLSILRHQWVSNAAMGQADQSRIVADAAKARYWNVSMASQDPALLRRLLRAKDRMDAASEEDWPVERLANVRGVSEAHFARSFKEAFGVPPHRYHTNRRVEQAKVMLAERKHGMARRGRPPSAVRRQG